MSKLRRLFILGIFLVIFVFQILIMFRSQQTEQRDSFSTVPTFSKTYQSSNLQIAIGAVICSPRTQLGPREEAVVMIKSVIISAQLYNVSKVEFHLFLERRIDADYYSEVFKGWDDLAIDLQIQVYIHSVMNAVPVQYQNSMVYDQKFRCGFVRMFFSSVLSKLDSILYLDIDAVVTGSIADLWSHLGKMTEEQLIGVMRNNEPNNIYWKKTYARWFSDIPHPPPKGLNSGVLLMNLTRMRSYRWEEKVLRLFDDYSKLYEINDQRLLNILLYFDEGLLQILPCQFNFRFTHCDRGLFCDGAEEDPKGVQLVHGAANYFLEGRPFHQIYSVFNEINLIQDIKNNSLLENVMKPLREAYRVDSPLNVNVGSPSNRTRYSQCFGILDRLLFKNYFL